MPAADTTIVPFYEKIVYSVFFYTDESKTEEIEDSPFTVDSGSNYCLNGIPTVPAKSGYTGKWVYADGDFGNTVRVDQKADDKRGLDVWAEYTQTTFTVVYTVEDKTYQTDTYYAGNKLTLPADPVVEGKDFVKWVDEKGVEHANGETVSSDLALSAVFSDMLYVNFVVLNDDGTEDERLAQYFRNVNEAIGTMPQDPFVAGKVFEKWVKAETGAHEFL